MSSTGVTLNQIRARSNRAVVKTIVTDIVRTVDAQILQQHGGGFSQAEIELPTVFNITGLSMYDAQIMVYSELIEAYRTKGWKDADIGLRMDSGGKVTLIIRWLNGMDKNELEHRKSIIKAHLWP